MVISWFIGHLLSPGRRGRGGTDRQTELTISVRPTSLAVILTISRCPKPCYIIFYILLSHAVHQGWLNERRFEWLLGHEYCKASFQSWDEFKAELNLIKIVKTQCFRIELMFRFYWYIPAKFGHTIGQPTKLPHICRKCYECYEHLYMLSELWRSQYLFQPLIYDGCNINYKYKEC